MKTTVYRPEPIRRHLRTADLPDALERSLSDRDDDRADAPHRRWQERFSPEADAHNLGRLLEDLQRRRYVAGRLR